MPGHQCHHCKRWVDEGEPHDCWTTTEAALTRELPDDLREAWDRLRETAAAFGDQRIYASHKCIMFARSTCYFYVRPKPNHLELCVFLGRTLKAAQVRRVDPVSKTKLAHFLRITHRDEVEAPITDWLQEAYESSDALSKGARASPKSENQMAKPVSRAKSATTPKRDDGRQLARLRRICLSIPGTMEKLSHGEPTFFTPKKVFAMFANNHHDDGRIAVWLPAAPGVQMDLIDEAPETYFRPPYVGPSGWVGVVLSKVDDEQLGALVREAFHVAAPKSTSSRAAKPSRKKKQTAS
jgi:hypothetical protein